MDSHWVLAKCKQVTDKVTEEWATTCIIVFAFLWLRVLHQATIYSYTHDCNNAAHAVYLSIRRRLHNADQV